MKLRLMVRGALLRWRSVFAVTAVVALIGPTSAAARNLLVSDFSGDRIKEYNGVTGAFVRDLVRFGIDGPRGLEFMPDGNLLANLTSGSNRRIARFDRAQGFSLGNFVTISGQEDIYLAPNGFYYTTGTTATNTNVYRWDQNGAGGQIVSVLNGGGASGVTMGPDGRIYVAVFNGRRVESYNAGGGDRRTFSGGLGSNSLSAPTWGPDGNLYVAGGINGDINAGGRVFKIDGQTGGLIGRLGDTGEPFAGPVDVEFGPDGYLYVSTTGLVKKIVKVHPVTGHSTLFINGGSGGLSLPWKIAWDPGVNFSVPAPLTGGSALRMTVENLSNPDDGNVAATDFGTEHDLSAAGDGTAVTKTNAITRRFVVDEGGTGGVDLFFNAALDGQLLSDNGGLASVLATVAVNQIDGPALGSVSRTFDVQSAAGSPDNVGVDSAFTLELALQAGVTYELVTSLTVTADNTAGGTAEALFDNTFTVAIDTVAIPEPAAALAVLPWLATRRRR